MTDLAKLNSRVKFDTTVYHGRYVIDGKSILGLFSLGGVEAEIEYEEDVFYEEDLEKLIQKYYTT
jgi:hypothetical protein